MVAKVLFFSLLRDLSGADEADWEVAEDGVLVSELLEQVYAKWPAIGEWDSKLLVAVDLNYVERDAMLMPGQEIALMPPVQGG